MSNTFTDFLQTEVMPMSLDVLREACVMPMLVNSSFRGDIVKYKSTVRIPAAQNLGDADDMATDIASGGTSATDLDDPYVDIAMDQWKYKQFQMTDKEMEESIASKAALPNAAEESVRILANAVNSALLGLYKDIPYFFGSAGVTPSTEDDILGVRLCLQDNKCPLRERFLTHDTKAGSKLVKIATQIQNTGTTTALREAIAGRLSGFDLYEDQQVSQHTAGTMSAVEACCVNGAVAAAATTMNIDGGSGTETIKDGDLFTVSGATGQYVFTADKTATAGAITSASFYPAAPTGGFADNAVITIIGNHTPNLAFNRNAFALAVRGLANETNSESSTIVHQTDPVSGLSLRLETWRRPAVAARQWRYDILFGVATVRPEFAARLLG